MKNNNTDVTNLKILTVTIRQKIKCKPQKLNERSLRITRSNLAPAQIWRLLKPGGEIVIHIPNISGLYGWNTFAADPTHITPFNETRLKCCLKVAGFKDSECKELALPGGLGDLVRTILHKPIFLMHRFMMRCVGANPVKILTHNVIAIGRKS